MAAGYYKVVLQNEQFMNDAFSSVFSNLHKAARKKNDYIWSTTKFDSLNSIWGDYIEPNNSKVHEDLNNVEKISKANQIITGNDNVDNPETHESGYETYTEEISSKMNREVFTENIKGTQKILETSHDVNSNNVEYKHPHNNFTICNDFKRNQEMSGDFEFGISNKSTLKKDSITRQSHFFVFEKSKGHIYKNYDDGVSQVMGANELKTGRFKKEAEEWNYTQQQNMTIFPTHRNIRSRRNRPNASNENISSDDDTTEKAPSSLKPKHHQRSSKSQVKIIESGLNEQKVSRSKRTRHNSDSSTSSNKPHQKKISGRTENLKGSMDLENNLLNTMLSVKIIDIEFHEYTVNQSDFNRVIRKFPELSNVFPGTDAGEKEVGYCFDAMKVVFGFLFNPPNNLNLPEGRIGIEILAATKSWGIQQFYNKFQNHFVKNITKNNFIAIYSYASHFGLQEICDACTTFDPHGESFKTKKPYRSKKCSVAVSLYVEPLEYCIPLETADQTLNDNFDRDITNTVLFEAITKDFNVTGFGIVLKSGGERNATSTKLDIFYNVKILSDEHETEDIKLSKPFRSNIIIYFIRKILVKKGQKIQLSVETTIKPYLCFATSKNNIKNSISDEFSLSLESNYKVNNSSSKRFIIGKLLYNSVDPAN